MKITDKNKIREIMSRIIWDYNIDPYDLYEVVTGVRSHEVHFDSERVLLRMIDRLSWYDLVNLLGIERLRKIITPEIIKKIGHRDLKEKYDFIRKVIQGEPLSFPGWSPELYEKYRNTHLSGRRYNK